MFVDCSHDYKYLKPAEGAPGDSLPNNEVFDKALAVLRAKRGVQGMFGRPSMRAIVIALIAMAWIIEISSVGTLSAYAQTDEATSLSRQIETLNNEGRYSEAIPIAQRVLAILEKALGPEHPDVATSLSNLAVIYDKQGRYADAEPLHKRALAIKEKALGPNHPDVALS
jgi:tetratricopeptide (TPR) repeat protein